MYLSSIVGYTLSMKVLIRSIASGFANFGVMQLYNDPALNQAITTVIKMLFSVNLNDLLSFPKVSLHYFTLLEVLFRNHTNLMIQLFDTTIFLALLSSLSEGLQLSNQQIIGIVATTIDHLFSWEWVTIQERRPTQQDKDALKTLKHHMTQSKTLCYEMFTTLMNMFLFDHSEQQFTIIRPIFSLIVHDRQLLTQYQQLLIANQANDESKNRMLHDFSNLLNNVDFKDVITSRDVFSSNIADFRASVLQYAIRAS
jgi:exportin-7